MRKISCVFVFITLCYFSVAQKSSNDSVLNSHTKAFYKLFKQSVSLEDIQICEAGSFFIKYEIQHDGSLSKLAFSESMLPMLKDTIKKILHQNQSLFVVGENNYINSGQIVMVPVYIRINNCLDLAYPYPGYTRPFIDTSKASRSQEKDVINRINSSKVKIPLSREEFFLGRLAQSSISLFRFDDGEFRFNEKYVILPPIYIISF